jgi:homeobox protein cut-like
LLEYADYDEMKKELEIFKVITGQQENEKIPIEGLLLEKNKKLENEFTAIKMENIELKQLLETQTKEQESVLNEITTKNQLIAKLENDIDKLNQLSNNEIKSPSNHIENLMYDFTPNKAMTVSKDSSIVPILTSQRNRYKQRFEESQRNLLDLQSQLNVTKQETQKLQKDNIELYEKLLYQEKYQQNTITNKYKSMYETTIDPFQKFKNQQSIQAESLNPAERIAMHFTKLLTANKYSRIIFVIYAILLHLLVFFSVYEFTGYDTKPCQSNRFEIPKNNNFN